MKIDNTRDVIILGHPRSGSFWMQSCLPHYDCREAFNTVNFDITGKNEQRLLISPYKSVLLDKSSEDVEISNRISILNSIDVPKVTKILTFQFQYAHRTMWNDTIFDWVNSQNANIYWIKRKDKLASFKSLLVADALGKYMGPINATSCTVDVKRLDWLIDSLSYSKDDYIKSRINKPIEYVFYEDLLETEFKTKSSMIVQNSSNVKISNWNEIINNLPLDFKNDIGL